MQLNLTSDYFELFGIPRQFPVDGNLLVKSYQQLQLQLHPDKFASRSDAERRWSLQAASMVNEAYHTLSSDLGTAVYMLQLQGINIDEETDTQMDPVFLMEQMELRESLADAEHSADPFKSLAAVRKQLKELTAAQAAAFSAAIDSPDGTQARAVARQWQFLQKLQTEVKRAEERLEDNGDT